MLDIKDAKIAVIGMGYVDLPLAVGFEKPRSPVGSSINEIRITQLKVGHDNAPETNAANLDATQP